MENKFDIEKIDEYDKDELEIFKSKERVYQESGEALLEATLKIPFKNKEKVDKLLLKISQHKTNISLISSKIYELEKEKEKENDNHGVLIGYANNGAVAWGNMSTTISNQTYNFKTKIETTIVKYVNDENNVETVEVMDDVFQSVLGNYYLTYIDGVHLPLNRVIEIDEESNVGRWYKTMCKNFERGAKLERVLKEDEETET